MTRLELAKKLRHAVTDLCAEVERLRCQRDEALKALEVGERAALELCQGQDPANECWNSLATIRSTLSRLTEGSDKP